MKWRSTNQLLFCHEMLDSIEKKIKKNSVEISLEISSEIEEEKKNITDLSVDLKLKHWNS
jgi:hypothetical protein